MNTQYLSTFFEPKSVAIIGATDRPGSVGAQILENVVAGGFKGAIYPVNPKHKSLGKLHCYAAISEIDHHVDLAIIAIPAIKMPAVVRACGEHGVQAILVISAGFAEVGKRGASLQDAIVDIARSYNMPLMGPNCLGLIRPRVGLNATFSKSGAKKGHVALVAQSGAFCTALLDWADSEGFGFSAVASLGATADVGFGEVLDYLAVDPETRSIILYIEGISDARSFLSGLRVAARLKPVIVVKSGRNESGTRAATSHTGALAGADHVFDAAIRRAGAVRVHSVTELISASKLLLSGVRVEGARLAILTNGGGPGVMAADRAYDLRVPLAELEQATSEKLSKFLPAHWSHSNPIDILGDANADRYREATTAILADKGVDGLLVLLTPQGMTDPTGCAKAVIEVAKKSRKPILVSWMGENLVAEARHLFNKAGIPEFRSPDTGVEAFGYLACYRRNQKSLMQTPGPLSRQKAADIEGARLIIEHALGDRRAILSNTEAKAILRAFRINTTPSYNVRSAADALVAAESVGLPVAMKINSPDITHKTDVGGIRLNIREPRTVRTAFKEMVDAVTEHSPDARIDGVTIEPMLDRPHAREVMIGISRDPIFGPVVSFGIGGITVEVFADINFALPPINRFLGDQLIRGTRAAKFLKQFRNLPAVDKEKLLDVIQRVSEIACEIPEIHELDINPLLVDDKEMIAVDARIVVRPPESSTARYGHMAIHPYPTELITHWQLADGTDVIIRPIRPEDADVEQEFVSNMSKESKYFRFMQTMERLTPEMLARFTQIDYDREMAMIAIVGENTPQAKILGVSRYVSNPDHRSCEFALAVADDMQKHGLGRELMRRLLAIARDRNLEMVEGEVLSNNTKMLRLCERLGFHATHDSEDPSIVLVRHYL